MWATKLSHWTVGFGTGARRVWKMTWGTAHHMLCNCLIMSDAREGNKLSEWLESHQVWRTPSSLSRLQRSHLTKYRTLSNKHKNENENLRSPPPEQPSPYFPGLVWSQTPWQIAHHSFHLNNRLLGWGIARDGWGGRRWLYSVCVPGLIWSMLQQSESPVACSAQSRAVRYASGLWQPMVAGRKAWRKWNHSAGAEQEGSVDHWPRIWSRSGEWSYLIPAHARLCRLRGAEMCLILTSLSWTPDRLPKVLFTSKGRSPHYL